LSALVTSLEYNIVLGCGTIVIVYAISAMLLIPRSAITLVAAIAFGASLGFSLGTVVGIALIWSGANIGTCFSFFLSRFLLREYVEKKKAKKYNDYGH